MPPPLGFTSTCFDIVQRAAYPINENLRPAFYRAVADALAAQQVVGEGVTHRICRELQRRFLHPLSPHELAGGKYAHGAS